MPSVIVPLALSILIGSPVSPPCGQELDPWLVLPSSTPSGPPIASGVSLSYSIDRKELTVFPPKQGRVFCSGFESYSVNRTIHSGARNLSEAVRSEAVPPALALPPSILLSNSKSTSLLLKTEETEVEQSETEVQNDEGVQDGFL